jgi:hypothetical protein
MFAVKILRATEGVGVSPPKCSRSPIIKIPSRKELQ